jgi:hypothetical protein
VRLGARLTIVSRSRKSKASSRSEIEEEVGDVVDYLSGATESATDDEVARLIAKDKMTEKVGPSAPTIVL